MAKRKTIALLELVEFANKQLAHPQHSAEFKQGTATMIEHALHKAGRYEGFRYINPSDVHEVGGPNEFDRVYFFHHLLNEPKRKRA